MLDLDKTVMLSIEHCINFDLRDSNAILKQFDLQSNSNSPFNSNNTLFKGGLLGRLASENFERNNKHASTLTERYNPLNDDFDDMESISTQHDQRVETSIPMSKTFTTRNGLTVGLTLGQTGDSKRGTLLVSKLLQASQFQGADDSAEDEDEDPDMQFQTLNLADKKPMRVAMALDEDRDI